MTASPAPELHTGSDYGLHPAEPRLTYLVKRLESAVRRSLDAVLPAHGLTTPQYAALSILGRHPGLSSAQLARRSFVTPQSMQVMVAAFVRSGLVERRADPENQRILRMFLTDDGRTVLSRSQDAADQIERSMLAGLTNAQITGFSEALQTCARNLTAGPRATQPGGSGVEA